MPRLDELPAVAPADVSDDDLLLLYDNSAATNKSRQVTRADLLKDVAREDGDHNFGTSEITALTATTSTIVDLTVTTSLEFDSAATLEKMFRLTGDVTTAGTASGAGETLTKTVTGAAAGDFVSIGFAAAIDDGLIVQAWVSAADTVSIRFFNTTSGAISGATYSSKIVVMRFA